MRKLIILPLFIMMGCGGDSMKQCESESSDSIFQECDSLSIMSRQCLCDYKVLETNVKMKIDVDSMFSSEELPQLRKWLAKTKSYFELYEKKNDLCAMFDYCTEKLEGRYENDYGIKYTEDDQAQGMSFLYRVLNKSNVMFRPVSDTLFSSRMKYVFDIDVVYGTSGKCSYGTVRQSWFNRKSDAFVFDFKNKYIIVGEDAYEGVFSFPKECVYNGDYPEDLLEQFDIDVSICLSFNNRAVEEKYGVLAGTNYLNFLSHVNNYIFHDSKSSFQWLYNDEDGRFFLKSLYCTFHYDKDPWLNAMMLEDAYNYHEIEYDYLFSSMFQGGDDESAHPFRVCTGMMQFIVDNCYVEDDVDKFGLRNDSYFYVMEDCFDYYMGKVLRQEEAHVKEKLYETCAYMGYYLQKAFDQYVAHGEGDPRSWHNALSNALRGDREKNSGEFARYVRGHNYMGLEGYDEIFEAAAQEAE